jgi:replication-associated recombination protein RarA
MLFVGRKNEKKKIVESLRQGKNIILGGKFGIGRTSIIKEIAIILADERKFIFVDFGLTPAKMSEKLMKGLALVARFTKSNKKMGYKSMRHRISNYESSEKKQTVIVFDNIAKLTNQKIIFLRHLVLEKHFQFIAIVENFLSPNDLYFLKALLLPADVLSLHHLKKDDVLSFLRLYSDKHNLNWSEVFIREMAALIGGYPLGIITTLNSVTNKSV